VRPPRLAALTLVLALGGCSLWGMEGGPGAAGGAAPTASSTGAPVDAVPGPDGVQRVTISLGDDLRMHPAVVRAALGTVEFTFRNTGAVPHDIAVHAATGPAVDSGNVNSGQSAVVRVSVDRPGTYPFPCVYHESSGMVGQLVVVAR
jgi:plastocyanin